MTVLKYILRVWAMLSYILFICFFVLVSTALVACMSAEIIGGVFIIMLHLTFVVSVTIVTIPLVFNCLFK